MFWQLKVLAKLVFWAKLFSVALFTQVKRTYLKSVQKDGFFDTLFDLFKEKSFHLIEEPMMSTFYDLKSPKCMQHSIFCKTYFINRSQIFIALPKFYARHLGVKITGPYTTCHDHNRLRRRRFLLVCKNIGAVSQLLKITNKDHRIH